MKKSTLIKILKYKAGIEFIAILFLSTSTDFPKPVIIAMALALILMLVDSAIINRLN